MSQQIPFGASQITPQIAQATLMLLQRCQIKPNEIPVYQQIAYALNQVATGGQQIQTGPQEAPEEPVAQDSDQAA